MMTERRRQAVVFGTLVGWTIVAFPVVLWLSEAAIPMVVLILAITGLTVLGTGLVLVACLLPAGSSRGADDVPVEQAADYDGS
jgi:hypothetical protein